MTARHFVFLALATTLFSTPCAARDVNGNYATFGAGGESCAVYLESRKAGEGYEVIFQEWVAGHLSAYNLLLENTYNIMGETSPEELFLELDVLCEQNPDMPFVKILAARVEQLYHDRLNLSPNERSGWEGFLEEVREGAKGDTEEE